MNTNSYPFNNHLMGYQPKDTPFTKSNNSRVHLNIPYLPLIGGASFQELLKSIYKSIVDEATAAEFYARLLEQVPNELHKEFVEHAYQDELSHLQAFCRLYTHFTGQQAQYQVHPVQFATYKDGVLKALKDELEAAEFYRDVQLSNTDPLVKDTFFFAMIDELEHSTQFGVLYGTL